MAQSQAVLNYSVEVSPVYRRAVLGIFVTCFFAGMFGFNIVPATAELLSRQLHFNDSNIGLLQAAYSLPSIVVVLIAGILTDRIGARRSLVLFSGILFLGAVITALFPNPFVMALGRLVFGAGAESMYVVLMALMCRWWPGTSSSLAFAVIAVASRLGGICAMNGPIWAHGVFSYWRGPFLLVVAASVLPACGAVLYWVLELRAERRLLLPPISQSEKISFKEIFKFGVAYWYVVGMCAVFYAAVLPFQTFAVKFFMDVHGTSREFGGFLNSLLLLFAIIVTPLCGLLAKRIRRQTTLILVGACVLAPVYLMMQFTRVNLLVPMCMMGLALALMPTVLWPTVGRVVEPARHGTAFGVMTMFQVAGLAVLNLLIGVLNDHAHASAMNVRGYTPGMIVFTILGAAAIVFSLLLTKSEARSFGR